MTTFRKVRFGVVAIIALSIMHSINVGCRRSSEPKKVELSRLLEESSFVVLANQRWRSDLELEVIAADCLPTRRGLTVKAAPAAGSVIDVIKFSEHPSVSPESFVVFYRSSALGSEIVAVAPVYGDQMTSLAESSGHYAKMSELRKQLESH